MVGRQAGNCRVRAMFSKPGLTLILSFILLLGFLRIPAPRPPAPAQSNAGQGTISKGRRLGRFAVTVTDHKGQIVSGLTRENFQVFATANCSNSPISAMNDVPLTVVWLWMTAESMLPNRRKSSPRQTDFLKSSNSEDQVFVVNFNEVASLGLPSGLPFTTDMAELENAVLHGRRPGMTALYDAVYLGLEHLEVGARDKRPS